MSCYSSVVLASQHMTSERETREEKTLITSAVCQLAIGLCYLHMRNKGNQGISDGQDDM